ncbi:MAG: cupin domain-containing protein [Oceanibaculum nanhaiense]|uniref:cupin domain-containing protein n=1 Tax=Oceanibaculum nanhaiense TaxID=1909734 RepID=UPI0025A491D6|nr:cupin domain-containing protein [Oceanibaculum nanhaiense]MDM7945295.1 cupin domain-containing protein [Oceanibaculum nanhaiense]
MRTMILGALAVGPALLAPIALPSVALAADDHGPAATVETLVKTTKSWDGATLPAYAKGQPEITILHITVKAGQKLAVHRHPYINAGVLLKGELTVRTEDGKSLILRAGDPIVETVQTWHHGENSGDGPAEIVVFYAGIEGQPITIAR